VTDADVPGGTHRSLHLLTEECPRCHYRFHLVIRVVVPAPLNFPVEPARSSAIDVWGNSEVSEPHPRRKDRSAGHQ
jgi:hypothetical protein